MDKLDALRTFTTVVEAGSLSAAARKLDSSLPSVSRQIAMLEKSLGTRLLARTTRRMALTDTGRVYYDSIRRVLDDIAEAELTVTQHQAVPRGRLVISAPVLFGRTYVAPGIPGFLVRHPEVHVSLKLSDRYVHLIDERVDIAIRIGELEDSRLVARRLGSFRRVVCAAPAYMERMGVPEHPMDLRKHDCLLYSFLSAAEHWRFRVEGSLISVPVTGCFESDNQDAVLEVALQGIGLMLAPIWMVREHLLAGRLVQLLTAYQAPPVHIHAVFAHARLLSAKARALVTYLTECWSGEDFDAEGPRGSPVAPGAGQKVVKLTGCAPRAKASVIRK